MTCKVKLVPYTPNTPFISLQNLTENSRKDGFMLEIPFRRGQRQIGMSVFLNENSQRPVGMSVFLNENSQRPVGISIFLNENSLKQSVIK